MVAKGSPRLHSPFTFAIFCSGMGGEYGHKNNSSNGQRNLIIKYANDGNILNKLDVGNYEYGQKPHAVMSVDNTRRIIPSATLSTEFNELGKIGRIEDGNSLTSVDFVYVWQFFYN